VTPDEVVAREAIRFTQSAYHAAGDRGRVSDLVACFTADGVLEIASGTFEGRDAIAERLSAVGKPAGAPVTTGRPFLHHHLTTSHIEVTGPDTARASSYFLVMSPIGIDHCGRYADTYRLVGDRWLIERRVVTISWASPDSFVGATAAQ
jgi:hypothetical protein